MKYIIIITIILLVPLSCKHTDNEIGKLENYILTEREVAKDCNVYQMLFKDGNYIFRFSLAGSCKNLSIINYTKEYSTYLNKYRDSLINRRGLIIFDKTKFNDSNNELENSILTISKKYFKTNVTIIESDKNSFIIKVFE